MYDNPWQWKDSDLLEIPDPFICFVYKVTNLLNNKSYIGKKKFFFSRKKKGSKAKKIESDWKIYYGSNKELIQDVKEFGTENFKREILFLCKNQGSSNYLEAKEIFARDAIILDTYYNHWISCKIYQNHVKLT